MSYHGYCQAPPAAGSRDPAIVTVDPFWCLRKGYAPQDESGIVVYVGASGDTV